jgi:hypothetical protein
MWLLIWLKLTAAQGISYYHLGTFYEELDCRGLHIYSKAKINFVTVKVTVNSLYIATYP